MKESEKNKNESQLKWNRARTSASWGEQKKRAKREGIAQKTGDTWNVIENCARHLKAIKSSSLAAMTSV
jgi:hypothetical protein